MGIEYRGNRAVFVDFVGVDEAEGLLGWLQTVAGARVDLSLCVHLHPANLQVLMAAHTPVAQWPNDPELRMWLESALQKGELSHG